LTGVYLEGNRLRDLVARVLAAWPCLARLRSVTLTDNDIGDEGVLALLRSEHFGRPKELDIEEDDLAEPTKQLIEEMTSQGKIRS
jgi:hypothetical protein